MRGVLVQMDSYPLTTSSHILSLKCVHGETDLSLSLPPFLSPSPIELGIHAFNLLITTSYRLSPDTITYIKGLGLLHIKLGKGVTIYI